MITVSRSYCYVGVGLFFVGFYYIYPMLKKARLLLLMLTLYTYGYAQADQVQQEDSLPGLQVQQATHAILWEIKGGGLQGSSYLLGTAHNISYDTLISRFPQIDSILSMVELLVEEHASPEGSSGGVDDQVLTFQGTDSTVGSLMTGQLFNQLKKYILSKSDGNTTVVDNLIKMRPQLLVLALPMLDAAISQSENNQVSMDEGLLQEARKRNKKYMGLESPAEASEVIRKGISDQKAIKWMAAKIREPDSIQRMPVKKDQDTHLALYPADAYLQPLIYYYLDQQTATGGDYGGVLLRNQNWMQKLPALLRTQKCLIAVGLDHLKLQTGLIEQLRHAGYTVRAVMLQAAGNL